MDKRIVVEMYHQYCATFGEGRLDMPLWENLDDLTRLAWLNAAKTVEHMARQLLKETLMETMTEQQRYHLSISLAYRENFQKAHLVNHDSHLLLALLASALLFTEKELRTR